MKKEPNKRSRNIGMIIMRASKFQFEQKRPEVVVYKHRWDFHQNDPDPFPSVPHGHAVDGDLKLELWSGNVYRGKARKPCGRAKTNEMIKLYSEKGFLDFVEQCRKTYKNNYPYYHLPNLSPLRGNGGAKMSQRQQTAGKYRVIFTAPTSYSCDIEIVLYKSGSSGTGGRTTRKYTQRKKQTRKRKRYLCHLKH